MDVKLILFCTVLLVFAALVQSEFLYNRVLLKAEELADHGLKCQPGKTIIKVTEPKEADDDSDYDTDDDGRRSHMNFKTSDESCQICVCSVEGKDEYCSRRPAMNVNECITMASNVEKLKRGAPFDHELSLPFRIRRDLIWHNDEIPYAAKAKCRRGTSYYSNSINANDTDIDLPSEIESLLDYSNTSICSYCVCDMSGRAASCIGRNPWFCEYFRKIRDDDLSRDRYRIQFKQDRPAYFRGISYRLRRTMDESMFDMIEDVGSKTNESQQCIPFVSVYTDCNEGNRCLGCSKCNCTAAGKWHCSKVKECRGDEQPQQDMDEDVEEEDLEEAFSRMKEEMERINFAVNKKAPLKYAPDPEAEDVLEETEKPLTQEQRRDNLLMEMRMLRLKRSVGNDTASDQYNGTVVFHNTVDEVNEDTLKNANSSGTLTAKKVEPAPQASRRTIPANSTALHIEHTPPIFNPHAADNRIDTPAIHDDKEDLLVHHKVYKILGNQTKANKDRDLSKLLVNEMKPGKEIIGDKNAKPVSNITFTPENDTLTAVTFIAGNLLNKLWNMEKDVNENPLDTENIKHKTINNLLDLFKEPLNLRQETFLKHALEQISTAIENKDVTNLSLCESVKKLKKESLKNEPSDLTELPEQNVHLLNDTGIPSEALSKINNALDLMSKYERVQKSLSDLRSNSMTRKAKSNEDGIDRLNKNEEETLNTFGNILGSLTKLLLPNKKSKKFIKGLKTKPTFNNGTFLNQNLGNLNINDLTITEKDKIVLEYLNHMQNSPNCLLNRHHVTPTAPSIEGNILLNLSEFFKIKSMSDLLNLVATTKKPILRSKTVETTTDRLKEKVEIESTTETDIAEVTTVKADKESQFRATKDKLKSHLKTILQDVIELQNISGKSAKGKNIELSEALPCIYNLLKSDRFQRNDVQTINKSMKEEIKTSDKLTEIYDKLKKELKYTQTRRTNVGANGPRPKSAAVWERTIKNLKQKVQTRRGMDVVLPKSIAELKQIIDSFETSDSNRYKTVAFLSEVPAAERLVLLKTLALDTNKYLSVLKDIKEFLNKMITIPTHQYNIFEDFIENVDQNVDLNEKIIKNINNPKQDGIPNKRFKKVDTPKKLELENSKLKDSRFLKLSREQILMQLIKNRIKYYMNMKEASLSGNNDINYDLAKKIMFYLELGNYSLAKDLYRIFISQNTQSPIKQFGEQILADPANYEYKPLNRPKIFVEKKIPKPEPLIQFEEAKPMDKKMSWSNQDQLIKQLLTIQNLKP